MKTEWDYTDLAESYLKRPEYAGSVIDSIMDIAGLSSGDAICDIGAGVAHLTIPWLERGMNVTAVEPNDAMRAFGIKRTEGMAGVTWFEGTGEKTGQPKTAFKLVSFGSSFNVCDQKLALEETRRILEPNGWFTCMWNHRDLEDPLQRDIENIIRKHVKGYSYGNRRADQTETIQQCGFMEFVQQLEGHIMISTPRDDWVAAWRSHATLQRQAGERFTAIVDDIDAFLGDRKTLDIPYVTRAWLAQLQS